jgi:tocopherol cyclase
LQVPHSGYHWNGFDPDFFEVWYFRVTLPKIGESFAFMYSIFQGKRYANEDPLGKSERSGGAAQILGIDEQHLISNFPDVGKFWAAKDELALGH